MEETQQQVTKMRGFTFAAVDNEEELLQKALEKVQFDRQEARDISIKVKQTRWEAACLGLSKLIKDWKDGKIIPCYPRDWGPIPRCFQIRGDIRSKVFEQRVDEIWGLHNLASCSQAQYATSLGLLLQVEETYHAVKMRRQDQTSRFIYATSNVVKFKLSDGHNMTPPVATKDLAILRDGFGEIPAVAVLIEYIREDYAYILQETFRQYQSYLERPLDIFIVPSGNMFIHCYQAIREMKTNQAMQRIVFEHEEFPKDEVKINVTMASTKELEARLNKLDERQRKAVVGILEARCRPKAYILTGAPGTGKTHTLIEAVVQIHRRTKNLVARISRYLTSDQQARTARILVCTSSNNCTDELHLRIQQELPDANVVKYSMGKYLSTFGGYDVIVTTIVKSGSIQARLEWFTFDYVFLDNAGHPDASQSLVPFIHLSPSGCLVLVGDLKQLKPRVHCKQADELGLGTSILERLSKFSIYQRHRHLNEYNGRCITELDTCHRCDSRIIATSNRRFYNRLLKSPNETPRGLLKILRMSHPVQFVDVTDPQSQLPGAIGPCNRAVADVCAKIVKRLYSIGIEPSQIGIVCPNRGQVKQIRSGIISMLEDTTYLKDRFAWPQYVIKSLTWDQAEELSELKPDAIAALKPQLISSQLYKRIGKEEFVPYDIDTFLEDPTIFYEKRAFSGYLGECKVDAIEHFQGCERDIMIVSTIGTVGGQLELLSDSRRFNVAITRGRWLVIVIGNLSVLENIETWKDLMTEAGNEVDEWPEEANNSDPFKQEPLFHVS